MPHPLDQLTPAEAKKALSIVRSANAGHDLHFKTMLAEEPPKKVMIKYLEAEHSGAPIAPPPRIAYAVYYSLQSRHAEEIWVDLDQGKVVRRSDFPSGAHLPCDMAEPDRVEPIMLAHPEVQKAFKRLGMTEDDIKCVSPDGWMYGCDSEETMPRYVNFLMYMRDPKTNHQDSNIYGFPLPFVPVFDIITAEFVRIDWVATGGDGDDQGEINYNTRNTDEPILETLRGLEYLTELRANSEIRKDLKPYHVLQPEGPSYSVDGSLVKWQKWSFRVLFTPREGLVLHDVRYDGRQTFYRLSVSEMTVPYGDPRPPLHRKQAFDLGDLGAGYTANSLGLGCDCLGLIKYFDGTLVQPNGNVEQRKNVVCMHEQDDGILYKHTNFRTNVGRVARRRILVLQTVITVANYEYIFAWHFDQAGSIELEIRATGIISTQYIDPGKKTKWGTVVAPSVLAAGHQHVFSIRVDPAIDGHSNSVQVCETKLADWDKLNPKGTGFYNSKSLVEKSGAFDADPPRNRYIKIINENKINPITMEPVGYKISAPPTALLMAPEGSIARKRAMFATHHFWVTKHHDNEFFGGGVWTNQSSRETGGIADMVARNESVRNEDIVLFLSAGITHYPRIEDFPIMPLEKLTVGLHPYGFFNENPAMDVPTSVQEFNRSVEVKECRSCHKL